VFILTGWTIGCLLHLLFGALQMVLAIVLLWWVGGLFGWW